MSDWRERHIKNRELNTADRISRIKEDAEKNEAVIRAIDNEGMMIFSKDSNVTPINGWLVETRKIYIAAIDDFINIEAGVDAPVFNNKFAYARFSGGEEWFDAKAEKRDGEQFVTVTVKDDLALEKAIAVFKGIGLILEDYKKEIDEKRAKKEERNEV